MDEDARYGALERRVSALEQQAALGELERLRALERAVLKLLKVEQRDSGYPIHEVKYLTFLAASRRKSEDFWREQALRSVLAHKIPHKEA